MKKMPWKNGYFLLALSVAGSVGLKYCINASEAYIGYSNSILSLLICVCWFLHLRRLSRREDWGQIEKILTPCLMFMFCFSGSLAVGVQLDQNGFLDFGNWHVYVSVFAVSLAAAPLLASMIRKLETYNLAHKAVSERMPKREKGGFFKIWAILFVAYLLTLMASYPGFFTYDAETEVYMVFTNKYSTYQPLAHVICLGWIIRLVHRLTQSYNAGIFVYMVIQIAILSACFAYMVSFLRDIGVKRWICNLGTAFLALFPTVSMFVCCSTKDTLFSGGVVLMTTLLLEQERDAKTFWQSRKKKFLMVASMLLILFFRNNGIYALGIFLLLFALVNRRSWKSWALTFGLSLFLFFVGNQCLIWVSHAGKGPLAEMFCVPIQQMARVYTQTGDNLTEEDREILFDLIPQVILENYNPKLADAVKINFLEDNFKASPGKYIRLWVRLGLSHFDIYINSFLVNTYGYWYPDTVLDGYRGIWVTDTIQYEDSSYFAFATERPGERIHLFPALERFYENISLKIYQQKLPVISMLFSLGFWQWVYAFLFFYLWITHHRRQAFSMSVIGLLYLTVLFGPIALVRYVLYWFFAVPLVLALLFDTALYGDGYDSCQPSLQRN